MMLHSRSMSVIGSSYHELRDLDTDKIWRVVYWSDKDAILRLEVFEK